MRVISAFLLALTLTSCDMLDVAPSVADAASRGPISSRERSLIYAADGAAQQGNIVAAERDYMAAMKENSGHIEAHLGLAQMYLKNGQSDKAIPVLEEALKRDPDDALANYLTGKIFLEANRYDDAVAAFNRGLTSQPDNLDLATGKGIVEDMRGNHTAAQMNYLRGIKTNPNSSLTKVRTNLAMSYLLSGEPKKAVDILKNEGSKAGAPSVTRHNLALAYGLLGQNAQAKKLINGEMDEATRQLAIARMREYVSERGASQVPPLNPSIRDDETTNAPLTKPVIKPAAKKTVKPDSQPVVKPVVSAKPAAKPPAAKPSPSVGALIDATKKQTVSE